MQEFFSARVQRDVGAVPVLFARQHGLGRNGAVVQEPLQFAKLAVDEAADGGGNLDMTAGKLKSHMGSLG